MRQQHYITREDGNIMYHVLFGDETLDVAVGEGFPEGVGEGGVLGVSIEGHHSAACLSHLGQSHAVRLPCRHLTGETGNGCEPRQKNKGIN